MSGPIRIFVVEDNAALRVALRALLRIEPRFVFVGDAVNGQTAIDMAAQLMPDVILMDINLEGPIDGIEVTHRIIESTAATGRSPVIIGMSASGKYEAAMYAAGAVAFVPKDQSSRITPLILKLVDERDAKPNGAA